MSALNESHVEDAALEWFGELGYEVGHGPQLAPGEPAAERDSFGAVVLAERLREAIRQLNPSIPEDAREEALRKILRVGTPSLVQTNRAFHRMLRDGVEVEYPRPDDSIAGDRVRLLDFDLPGANDWFVVNQFTVIEGQHNRRPDIVVFVNGLPLGLIELKNAADEGATIWSAYLGKQDDPVPGTSIARWVPSPGLKLVTDKSAWPDLEAYIKDIVGSYQNDKRVVMWDLYNEPGNSGFGNKSQPLVEASFTWARQALPSQPLTISVWGGPKEISDRQIELSDVVSYHFYGDNAGMKARINDFKTHHRPVICTEWMARTLGAKYESELPLFKEEKVGCYNWGLVNGRTQCQYPWGSPKDAPEPKVWFHDLLRNDGSPKDAAEVAFIRKFTGAPGVNQLKPLFDFPVRDTCVCTGPDAYYLIGTTGAPTWWATNEGIRIWKSADLKNWQPIGLVWSFAKDMTWQKKQGDNQAIWAPEMHYFSGTYWIPYCVNYGGTGILKSTSGKAEGPYVDIKKDGPLTGEIDASLFHDDDGKSYFVYQNGKIALLKDDMTGLAAEAQLLKPANAPQVGFEGAFLFKANGHYYLSCADFCDGRYHCYVASSKSLMGPYGNRYLAIPCGGHNMFFKDKDGTPDSPAHDQ